MEKVYGFVCKEYNNKDTSLRIMPSFNMDLKDKMFIMQIYNNIHGNKQIDISKNNIDLIIQALLDIKNNSNDI